MAPSKAEAPSSLRKRPTGDDDEKKKKAEEFPTSFAPTVSNEAEDNEASAEEEEEEDAHALVASCQCTLVGIRYYTGTAHAGEYVTLVREPNNPYDRNAIRVDNLQGQKVGHIKKTQAALLAGWMDRYSDASAALTVEGTIPRPGNEFSMPVTVEFICHAPASQLNAHARALEQQLKQTFGHKFGFRSCLPKKTAQKKAASSKAVAPTVESKQMDWSKQAAELDAMFEQQSAQKLSNLPEIPPVEQLQTTLLDYQQAGLRWLVNQDTKPKFPFYSERTEQGRKVWHCSISNSSQITKPKSFQGGILCDEMGLGKTLQIISLILAAPPISTTAPRCTLIVCPVSVMANWEEQIRAHVKEGALEVGFYQGPSRNNLLPQIKDGRIHVVLVSYQTLAAEYSKIFGKKSDKAGLINQSTKKRKLDSIFDYEMHRLVLDEAHIIRSSKTRVFQACNQIASERRWALTGTPIVNRAEDLFSLFHFIGIQPLCEKNIFQRAISVPIQRGDEAGMACLRVAMAHVALRRSKATANIQLVDKTVNLTTVAFDEGPHKEVYDSLFGTVRAAFQAVLQNGDKEVLKNYTHIFEKLLRLRQACCSAKLVPPGRREVAVQLWKELQQRDQKQQLTAQEGLELLEKLKGAFQGDELPECAVCMDEYDESQCTILRTCSHVFCEACIEKVCSAATPNCPLCRKAFAKADMIKKSVASKAAATQGEDNEDDKNFPIDDESITASPKILSLLEIIKTSMKSDEKGVIFSQFTSFLDQIGEGLKEAGHSFTRLDGSMTTTKRMDAVRDFSSEDEGSPRFILCSLHAAGTGINLTRSNFAFMMDCWWNSAVENQAMDRIHRIGQNRPVTIYRFVMKGSVEEKIIALQAAKNLQAKGALQKLKPEEQRRARLNDLKGLLMIDDYSFQ